MVCHVRSRAHRGDGCPARARRTPLPPPLHLLVPPPLSLPLPLPLSLPSPLAPALAPALAPPRVNTTYGIVAAAVVVGIRHARLFVDAVEVFVQAVQQERQQLVRVVLQVALKLRPERRDCVLCPTQRGRDVKGSGGLRKRAWGGVNCPRTSNEVGPRADGASAVWLHSRLMSLPYSMATRPFMPSGLSRLSSSLYVRSVCRAHFPHIELKPRGGGELGPGWEGAGCGVGRRYGFG